MIPSTMDLLDLPSDVPLATAFPTYSYFDHGRPTGGCLVCGYLTYSYVGHSHASTCNLYPTPRSRPVRLILSPTQSSVPTLFRFCSDLSCCVRPDRDVSSSSPRKGL
jgi:hypothetical protein